MTEQNDKFYITESIMKGLTEPFPIDMVKWRVGGGSTALAYIDARMVQDRFDQTVGSSNWCVEYRETNTERVICRIGVRHGDGWVFKEDGAGATDREADKGGLSDAFKRAAVPWGVGRYLYGLTAPRVRVDNKQIASDQMPMLLNLLRTHSGSSGGSIIFNTGQEIIKLVAQIWPDEDKLPDTVKHVSGGATEELGALTYGEGERLLTMLKGRASG